MRSTKNQASKYFRCRPPALDVYLADLNTDTAIDENDYPSDEDVLDLIDDESDMSCYDGSSSDGEDEDKEGVLGSQQIA